MSVPRRRLDVALVDAGLAESRNQAQALIAAGSVLVDGAPATKASDRVGQSTRLSLAAKLPYVSRSGSKLAAALDSFAIDFAGKFCLDVGASTGGFTDCLLQRGAAQVVALDVGHGQLAKRLAEDPRVENLEGVNARSLTPEQFDRRFDGVVVDLSFISLTLVLPVLPPLLAEGGRLVALVKPQFEVGRERLGKGGVVRDAAHQREAVENVEAAAKSLGLVHLGTMESPILGGDGNREFLAAWEKAPLERSTR